MLRCNSYICLWSLNVSVHFHDPSLVPKACGEMSLWLSYPIYNRSPIDGHKYLLRIRNGRVLCRAPLSRLTVTNLSAIHSQSLAFALSSSPLPSCFTYVYEGKPYLPCLWKAMARVLRTMKLNRSSTVRKYNFFWWPCRPWGWNFPSGETIS